MKTVFISAPFRGSSSWDIELHIRVAEETGRDVALLDMVPLIPHTMYRFFQGAMPDDFWLSATTELLGRCDAVIFVGNWRTSPGCRGEMAYAKEHGIPIFYTLEDLTDWRSERREA
jgi:hypothetical protein